MYPKKYSGSDFMEKDYQASCGIGGGGSDDGTSAGAGQSIKERCVGDPRVGKIAPRVKDW